MAPEILAPVSIDEFWRLAHRLPRAELVAGQVIEMVPPGVRHGVLVVRLARRLDEHVGDRGLGVVSNETGFILSAEPPTVRAPDVAVVFKERMPWPIPTKFFAGPPDLAVEILSPDDRPAEIAAKVAEYLRAGARAVWIVDPEAKTVTVHTLGAATRYARDEVMHGVPPLPDFALVLQNLFADLD